MSRKDTFHNIVRCALEKDGWTITHDPLYIELPDFSEFHMAVGQFMNYRFTLRKVEPDRILYLAVPLETYETFFQKETIRQMCQEYRLKLVVYDTTLEEITQWIN